MTRFLADENFPPASVSLLRAEGLDVATVREMGPEIDDPAVLALAREGHRVLLRLDKGFGRLIYHDRYPAPPAVVYFRYDGPPGRRRPAEDLLALLSGAGASIEGFYVALDRHLVRRRLLP